MKILFSLGALLLALSTCQTQENSGFIYSVNGKIKIEDMELALTHEHIMSNFGLDPAIDSKYDSTALFNQVVPYLKKVKALGVNTIFDCTTAYFGRDVNKLKAFADITGLNIITNTGYYGSAKDKYVPEFAYTESEEEISKRWIAEFENGIDNTDIKPGFVKLAFDDGKPSDIDIKLFKAGVLTHQNTGLTLAVHTGGNVEAIKAQLNILEENGVSPSAWVWVHANKMKDHDLLINTALKGAWISLDGIKEINIDDYVELLVLFKKENLLHQVLIAHDGNSFPRGGKIRNYDSLITFLIPALKSQGFTKEEIDQLTITNPQNAFKIRVRNED